MARIVDLQVDEAVQKRFDTCCEEIAKIIDRHLPEVHDAWEKRDPGSFVKRVFMTMYMEMIHAGFFSEQSKPN